MAGDLDGTSRACSTPTSPTDREPGTSGGHPARRRMGSADNGAAGVDRRVARQRFLRGRRSASYRRPDRAAHSPARSCDPWSPRTRHWRIGGVGRFAVQLAHLGGANVTALVSSGSARAAGLRELGADDVVLDVAQLRGRFDLILESVGGDTLGRLVTMVDPQGTLVMFGNSSNQGTTFNVRDIYLDASIRLQGFELFFGGDPSAATSPTLSGWSPRANSIRSASATCHGTRCLQPWNDFATETLPERSALRSPVNAKPTSHADKRSGV